MITVVPVRLIRSSSSMIPSLVSGSRLPVGSSASSTSGRFTNARAIATRCCSPPDSSLGSRCALPSRPTISSTSGTTRLIVRCGLLITSRAKATFWATVRSRSRRKSWKTQPMVRRSFGTFHLLRVFSVWRSEEHTSELQSRQYLVCRLLLEKKKKQVLHIRFLPQNSLLLYHLVPAPMPKSFPYTIIPIPHYTILSLSLPLGP